MQQTTKRCADDAKRRQELGDFLRTRRARVKPNDVGYPPGIRRRTPGLRREEVAELAGVGLSWYTWLEQGRDIRVSTSVLDAIGRSLLLSPTELDHLLTIGSEDRYARMQDPGPSGSEIPATVRQLLTEIEPCPAYVTGYVWDVLAWNRAAEVLLADFGSVPEEKRNIAWMVFLHEPIRRSLVNWEVDAERVIEQFRAMADRAAGDPRLTRLISELREHSELFRLGWDAHDIRDRALGREEVRHHDLGRFSFDYITLTAAGAESLRVVLFLPADRETRERLEGAHQRLCSNPSVDATTGALAAG